TRIHLDTDLGSDTDDLCALAMVLGWPDAELVGVTTSTDPGGRRAGFVAYALELGGRSDVPFAAGAEGSIGGLFEALAFPDYWPVSIAPRPSPAGAAVELLESNARVGAVIVAVGPYTNLAMLETARPGLLASAGVVVMGGHHTTPRDGLPPWGMRDDFNVQQDAVAASIVFGRCDPIVVPLAVSLEVCVRSMQLSELRDAGALGALIADQAKRHARDNGRDQLPASFPGLPGDLLNFQYDPLACAVALGWDGVTVERVPCSFEREDDGVLRMERREGGVPLRTAVAVEAERFEREWLEAVCVASARRSS
ncbi:MAG: nucleoside hydrolase, partial [Actinomycetota bacterium]